MHELGIVQAVLDRALARAAEAGATRISAVRLRIGPLAGVVAEALSFAWDCCTSGTLAEQARLEIEETAIVAYCQDCRSEFDVDGWLTECPGCGTPSRDIRQGNELELTSLEIA